MVLISIFIIKLYVFIHIEQDYAGRIQNKYIVLIAFDFPHPLVHQFIMPLLQNLKSQRWLLIRSFVKPLVTFITIS